MRGIERASWHPPSHSQTTRRLLAESVFVDSATLPLRPIAHNVLFIADSSHKIQSAREQAMENPVRTRRRRTNPQPGRVLERRTSLEHRSEEKNRPGTQPHVCRKRPRPRQGLGALVKASANPVKMQPQKRRVLGVLIGYIVLFAIWSSVSLGSQ